MSLHFLPPPPARCPDGCGDFCPPRPTIASIPHLTFPHEAAGALLAPKSGARPAPTIVDEGPARRLLRELLDHADVIGEGPGGGAYLLVDLPRYAIEELAIFNAEFEDVENDDPAEDADATEDDDAGEESDDAGVFYNPARDPKDIAIRERLRARSGRQVEAAAPITHPVLGVYRRIDRRG